MKKIISIVLSFLIIFSPVKITSANESPKTELTTTITTNNKENMFYDAIILLSPFAIIMIPYVIKYLSSVLEFCRLI